MTTFFRWVGAFICTGLYALGALQSPSSLLAQSPTSIGSRAHVFEEHRADPRSRSSYLSVVQWDAPWLNSRLAAIGVGDGLTVARGSADPVELEFLADFVIHAQFDLDGTSSDFVNADFLIGFPLALRVGPWSGHLKVGHWSAHLGDEFLLRSGIQRVETSIEFVEVLLARDLGPGRLLLGWEHRPRIHPDSLPPTLLRAGADVRSTASTGLGRLGRARLVASMDARWDAATGNRPAIALQAGVEVIPQGTEPGHRVWALQFEFFDGPSPFGQFFLEPLRTVGIGFRVR